MSGSGADPMIVFVPGLGLDGRSWQFVEQELAGTARVALLPSLGARAPRGADLGVPAQVERLLAQLDDARDVVLVGHSASCPVVVAAALRSPAVRGLVLIGPVTDPRAKSWPRLIGQWLRVATHEEWAEAPIVLPQYWRAGGLRVLRAMHAVRDYRTDRGVERLAQLDGLPRALVVIRGEKDRIAAQDWSKRVAEAGGGRLDVVPGSAHMIPLTDPAAVVAAIRHVAAAPTSPGP